MGIYDNIRQFYASSSAPVTSRVMQSVDQTLARAERFGTRALDSIVKLADATTAPWRPTPPSTTLTQIIPINVTTWSVNDVRSTLDSHELGQFMDSSTLKDAMGRDDRITGCLNTRVRALAGKAGVGFSVKPSEKNDKTASIKAQNDTIAKEVNDLWWYSCPEGTMSHVLRDAVMLGMGLARIHWDLVGGLRVPRLEPWDLRGVYWDWSIRRFRAIAMEGIFTIDQSTSEWFLYEPAGYRSWMNGAVRCLGIPWLLRQMTFRDWARYSEKHGMPIITVKEPSGTQWDKHKANFWSRMARMGTETTLRLPQDEKGYGFAIELIEAKARSHEAFNKLIERLDINVAVTLLGQNLTTEVQGGSHAAAQAHELIRLDYLDADAATLSTCLREQIWKAFVRFNYAGVDEEQAPWPTWETRPAEDKQANAMIFSTVLGALAGAKGKGIEVPPAFVDENFSIPFTSAPAPAPVPPGKPGAPPDGGPPPPPTKTPASDTSASPEPGKSPVKVPAKTAGKPDAEPVDKPAAKGVTEPEAPEDAQAKGAAPPVPAKGTKAAPKGKSGGALGAASGDTVMTLRAMSAKRRRRSQLGLFGAEVEPKPEPATSTTVASATAVGGTRTVAGIQVRIDRPQGFVQTGTTRDGVPWSRTYTVDYGEIPGTEGGDQEPIDVFCGPQDDAPNAYWIIQVKHDGSFDEFKLMLSFAGMGDALACYLAHVPAQYLGKVFAMPVSAVRALLGLDPDERGERLSALAADTTDRHADGTPRWAYHGTSSERLPSIREYGLIPGAPSPFGENYSNHDDGNHLFFSDKPETVRGVYGDTVLRFPWPKDAKIDVNKFGRSVPGQFATKMPVATKDVEVEAGGSWAPVHVAEHEEHRDAQGRFTSASDLDFNILANLVDAANVALATEHDPKTGEFTSGDGGAAAGAPPKPAHERKPITHEKLVQIADGLRAAVRSAHGNAVADHELKHWLAEALVHRGVSMGTAEKAAKESSQQRADKLAARTPPAEAEKALHDFETRTNAEKDAWRASKTGKATKASAIGDDVPVALDYNPNQARGADGKWGEGEIAAQKAAIAHAEAKRVASMEASGNAQFASRNAESDTRRVANNERAVVSHQAAATAARESAAAWRAVPGGPVSEVQMSPNRPPVTFDHLAREKDISAKSHDALAARHADNAVKIGVAEAAHAKAVETTANADRKAAEARDSRPRDLSSNLSAAAVAHTEAAAAHEQARVAQEGARLFKQAAESATKASEHQADAAHAATKAIQEPSAIIPSNPDDRAKTREEADGLSRMTEHYDKAAARADGLVAGIPGHADPTEHAAALGRVAGAHDVAAHWHNEAALDHRATGNDAKAAEHDAAAAAHVAASEKLKGDAERLLGKEQPRAYVAVPAVNPVRVGNGSVDPNERHEFFEHTNADGTTERLAKNVIGTISNIGRNKVEAAAMIRAIQEHPSVHAMLERHPLQELAFARISARATYIAGASYDVRTTRNIVSGEVTAREVRVVMNTAVKDEKDVTNPKYGVPLDPGKTLTVSRASSSFEESRQISLMHELGHHLQEAPGVSEHVDRGWDNRPKGFGGAISEYATKNRDEYFAESFAAYQYHNEALKEHDPNGHRMIENSLKHVGAIK